MKRALILCVLLSGCAQFENRVACTVDKSQALYVSKYGPIGVASEIAKQDAKAICK